LGLPVSVYSRSFPIISCWHNYKNLLSGWMAIAKLP
jgi:hypothetical protein